MLRRQPETRVNDSIFTLLNKVSRLGVPRDKVTAKNCGPLCSIVDVANILLEIGWYFSIPNGSRDGDRDGTTDRTPKIENSDSDSHILMRHRSLYSDVGCGDDDGSTDTGKDLRADEDGRGRFRSR